jgi:hypothetical protein
MTRNGMTLRATGLHHTPYVFRPDSLRSVGFGDARLNGVSVGGPPSVH